MPARSKLKITLVPDAWKRVVIALLDSGKSTEILWTDRAMQNWQYLDDFGTKDRAYDHLIATLEQPHLLGHDHPPQQDKLDWSYCDTWAFLSPHPQGFATPVYAKIALHNNQLRINLISLHIDLTKELEIAIAAYLKK